jgi:PAS domain S-box-containing protein
MIRVKLPPKILLSLMLTLSGTGYFIYSSLRDHKGVIDAQEWVNHTNEVIKSTDHVYTAMAELESAARGYVISGDKIFLQDVHINEEQVRSGILKIRKLVSDNPEQTQRVRRLEDLAQKKMGFYYAVENATTASQHQGARLVSSMEGKKLMDSLKTVVAEMKTAENNFLGERITRNKKASENAMRANIASGIIFCLFALILLYLLYSDIKNRKLAEQKSTENELKYRTLIENSGVVTYTANPEGVFTFVSSQAEELTGFSSAELIGTSYANLVQPDYLSHVTETYVNQLKQQIRECILEFPIVTKNGQQKWVEQYCVLQSGPHGQTGYQCIVKDITQQKIAEIELGKVEAARMEDQYRLQAILDNTPLIIYVKDLEGRYIVANKRFTDTFHREESSIIGKTFKDLFISNENVERYRQADKAVIATGKPVELEDVIPTPNGPITLYTTKFPLFDKDNRLFATGGIAKDVTELSKAQERLIDARKKAEQAEKLQEQFLANMSHEIRTPMNGIVGMTELLSGTDLSTQQKGFVQLIRRSSDTLLVLINDILDLSKIKAGRLDIENIPFSIHDVVDRVMDSMKIKTKEKNLEFRLSVDKQIKGKFLGDPHRLEQILLNLVSNAVKFTSQGHVGLDIHINDRTASTINLCFGVSDTGIGISADKLRNIFDNFTQAENDISRKFGGTGLGLAITKNLVELQKGTINVNSVLGEGTSFEVVIPYQMESDDTINNNEEIELTKPPHHCFKGKKVLIVEDNEINQQVMFHHLKNMGIVPAIANNGREAIGKLEEGESFELVIMDLQMPEMNGFQTATYIRRKLQNAVPIIAMTASVLRNERRECLELGMNEYLSKPFVPGELLVALQQFLLNDPEKTPASIDSQKIFHKGYDLKMLSQTGDEKLIAGILELFLQQTPEALKRLKEEVMHENWDSVKQQAHKLKGSSGLLHISRMTECLDKIEKYAGEKECVDEILPLIAKLESEFSVLKPMLERERVM